MLLIFIGREKKNQLSDIGYINHTPQQAPCSQNGHHVSCMYAYFVLVFFVFFFFASVFGFWFLVSCSGGVLFCLREKTFTWVGREVRRIWEELEEKKEYSQIYCMKNI